MNIIDHLQSCGFDAQRTGKQSEYIMVCPQCGKKKLGINIDKSKWQCFKCATGGGLDYLCKFLGIKKLEVETEDFRKLRNRFIETPKVSISITNNGQLPKEFIKIGTKTGNFMESKALSFLYGRGITDRQIEAWNLGYCISGPYTGFLIIPVVDLEGNVRTWQGRRIFGVGNKSANPINVDKIPFNLQFANGYPGIVIVEGPWDAIAVHSLLSKELNISSIALMGHTCSPLLARQIVNFIKPLYVWVALDPDISRAESERMSALFRSMGIEHVKTVFLNSDPDEVVNIDEWKEYLNKAEEPIIRRINR